MLQPLRNFLFRNCVFSGKNPTLVPEAIYRGSVERSEEQSEERSESPLVEFVGNLTSMLSKVQKLNLNDDWLTYSLSYKLPLEPG